VPVLKAARDAAPAGPGRQSLTYSLAGAYGELKQWDAMIAEAQVLERELPAWSGGYELHRRALYQSGRKAEERKLSEERLRARPDDAAALRDLQLDAIRAGDWAASEKAGLRALELSQGAERRVTLNNHAWLALCAGKADETAVEQARQAIELAGGNDAAALNTLAALYGALGRVAEARQSLAQLIANKDEDQLDEGDWFIVGLVAEGDGLPKTALAAYGHIKEEKGAEPDSIAYLMRKHVEAIKAAK
jgi:tetratricopeptide (TPR) repeat protein